MKNDFDTALLAILMCIGLLVAWKFIGPYLIK